MKQGGIIACAFLLGCTASSEVSPSTSAWTGADTSHDTDESSHSGDDDDDDGPAGCSTDCDSTTSVPDATQGDDQASLSFVEPGEGDTVLNPVRFEVVGQGIDRVDLVIDSTRVVPLGWDLSQTAGYLFSHSFLDLGAHQLELRGYAEDSALVLADAALRITVEGEPGDGTTADDDPEDPDDDGMSMALCDAVDDQPLIVPTTCDGPGGNTTTEVPNNHKYSTSWFGCYFQSDGTIYMDPYDNCEFACGNMGLCPAGQSGPECEANLRWFAANADRYGCGGRIRVTDCESGRAVILATLDRGPNCNTVEKACNTPVLDMSHDAMEHLFAGSTYGGCDHQAVVVEQVADDAPLGPW